MVIIDFSNTKQQALVRGLYKGMAAPVMLFGQFKAPILPEVMQITLPSTSDERSLEHDWTVIGADFNNAIAKYGKESLSTK